MARFSIIRDDNMVVVGGVGFTVDCSALPADVHAVQVYDTHAEIEYSTTRCDHCGARSKKANETNADASSYASYYDAWEKARIAAAEAEKLAAEKLAAEKAVADVAGPES